MKRPDFYYGCECGYLLCGECGTPWYPMEVEDSSDLTCPDCGGTLLCRELVRLAGDATAAGGWASVLNILTFGDGDAPLDEDTQKRQAADNLRSLVAEAQAFLDRLEGKVTRPVTGAANG